VAERRLSGQVIVAVVLFPRSQTIAWHLAIRYTYSPRPRLAHRSKMTSSGSPGVCMPLIADADMLLILDIDSIDVSTTWSLAGKLRFSLVQHHSLHWQRPLHLKLLRWQLSVSIGQNGIIAYCVGCLRTTWLPVRIQMPASWSVHTCSITCSIQA
jgi:hypothetical protein